MEAFPLAELARAISEHIQIRTTFPIEIQAWNAQTCADFMSVSVNHFKTRIACLPGFPKPVRLPTKKEKGIGQPRWNAKEVINWFYSFKKSNLPKGPGRPRNKSGK